MYEIVSNGDVTFVNGSAIEDTGKYIIGRMRLECWLKAKVGVAPYTAVLSH